MPSSWHGPKSYAPAAKPGLEASLEAAIAPQQHRCHCGGCGQGATLHGGQGMSVGMLALLSACPT